MSALLETLRSWKPFRVVVVGDLMLDDLVYGNADRISPEAPVPVLHVVRSEHRPGGAANLALNLVAMRAGVSILGVVGADEAGAQLTKALASRGIDAGGVLSSGERPTTVKRSLIGLAQHRHPQKMFRLDYESREPLSDPEERALIERYEASLSSADIVCVEDYNKGVCTPAVCDAVISLARRAGVEVIVDPAKGVDYTKYRGATAITPNRTEGAEATGIRVSDDAPVLDHARVGDRLVEGLGLECALLTLDRHGSLLVRPGAQPEHVPTVARTVYDVSGAGDMVIAALAGGRANGLGWRESAELANIAAGLEVERFGVVPIPLAQIHREAIQRAHTGTKVMPLEDLGVLVETMRDDPERSRPVVFTNGCFDILHNGHLSILHRAAALEPDAFLIVAVNSDESVRRLGKGPDRPVNTQQDRAELLGGLGCVGAVVIFDEDTPERVIRRIRPDVLVKGSEYSLDQVPGGEFVRSTGGRVELLSMVEGKSTTSTLEKIRSV